MTQLDEHGARILAFVERYQRQHHRSPTYREIGAGVGLASNDHVARDLRRLKQQGYLSYTPGVSRSIVLLKTPRSRQRSLPLAAAATLSTARHQIARNNNRAVELSHIAAALFEDEKDVFILRARGEAMQDAMMNDGDLVVIKRNGAAQDGDMVAVWSKAKQQTILRHLYHENGHFRLQAPGAENKSEYVKPAQVEIRGTVLAIIRHEQ